MNTKHGIQALVDETEELLAHLGKEHGPAVDDLRDRLEKSMRKAKVSLKTAPPTPRVRVRDVAASFNDYVRHYPWMALATGVLVASTVGIMATGALKRSVKN